jgi:predicted RNA binding protein YcfA (HicA-like mRNA interferase family)
MPSLPHLSGAEVVRVLERLGFVVARQRGSHIVMRRAGVGCVVPNHREVKIGTLSGVLKQAGVSSDEFVSALRERT